MNFALLGDDAAVLPLLRSIAADRKHRLSHAAVVETTRTDVLRLSPGLRMSPQWEELLAEDSLDAVIVVGENTDVLEGARQLATAGKALLVFPHSGQGSTWVYELTLIRDDLKTVLFPAFPLQLHPQVRRLQEVIERGELGEILRLQIECDLPVAAGSSSPSLLSTTEIDEALLPDVDLLRNLGGDYDRVTAVHSGPAIGGISLANVRLAGDNLPQACWSAKKAGFARSWLLEITGTTGSLALTTGTATVCQTHSDRIERLDNRANSGFDFGAALLEQFEQAMAPEKHIRDWIDLARTFEIVEGARRSSRERKTIELHFEIASERSRFKTQMTVLGCCLLSVTCCAVILLLLLGALFDVNANVMRIARVAVFLPLFVFLALQLLLFLARPSSADTADTDS